VKRAELRQHLRDLADQYGWRYLADNDEALGLHRGVAVLAREDGGELRLMFYAPTAEVGDEILEHYQGFQNCAEAGVATDWFGGLGTDDHTCVLRLDGGRLEEMGTERFLQLPELVARDFHAHGAAEEMACTDCGEHPAEGVRLIENVCHCLCRPCLQLLAIRTVGGKMDLRPPVRWRVVLVRLALAAPALAVVWGFLQQRLAEQGRQLIGTGSLILLGALGVGMAWLILPKDSGVRMLLRLLAGAAAALAVLLGNFWGYATVLSQNGIELPWTEVLRTYFTFWVPESRGYEVAYCVVAAAGVEVGLFMFDRSEKLHVR
jgi:hypothetical protein